MEHITTIVESKQYFASEDINNWPKVSYLSILSDTQCVKMDHNHENFIALPTPLGGIDSHSVDYD